MNTTRSLEQWLSYLEGLHPSAIDMGLERSAQVLARLNLGVLAPRVITVTGTNGKGSTCAFVAQLLRSQGLRVGMYNSPHLLHYNERVSVDGVYATDAQLCTAFAAVEAARGEISLTYFEMGTLAAFWLFAQQKLDAVVLEVGLGGRLDAVNLVDADVALVTSIGVDHSDWLGDTRESVAFEKAGIFRTGRPALCGDINPPAPLLDKAAALQAPLSLRGCDFDLELHATHWSWRGLDAKGQVLSLSGLPLLSLPMENAALALQAYAVLGLPWQPDVLLQALQQTRVVGRLDERRVLDAGRSISLLLDVGHNPQAAEFLAKRLAARQVKGRIRAVFGLLADKDLAGVIEPLNGLIDSWVVAPLPTMRTRTASELASGLKAAGAQVQESETIAKALTCQVSQAREEDLVLVFGSFYCVAEALMWLSTREQGDQGHGVAG